MRNKFAMKMKRLQTILAGMLMLSCMVPQSVRAQEPVKQSEENMKWFADAKLGTQVSDLDFKPFEHTL